MFKASHIVSKAGIVRMMCALSLLLVAFAHRPLTLAPTQVDAAELARFVLPDGTLPDLCLSGDDDPHHLASRHCEACRIVACADLPTPAGLYVRTRWSVPAQLAAPQDTRPADLWAHRSAQPRAPPALAA